MKYLLSIISLFLTFSANAQESLDFTMGGGLGHSANSGIFVLSYQNTIEYDYKYRLDWGSWGDSANKSSMFSSFLVGKETRIIRDLYLPLHVGVLFLSHPDLLLSTSFQFTEEIGLMYKKVGIGYKHISNAGFKEPNIGRDYFYLKFRYGIK